MLTTLGVLSVSNLLDRRLHWLWTGAVSSLTSLPEVAVVHELSNIFGEYSTMYCRLDESCNDIWGSGAFVS